MSTTQEPPSDHPITEERARALLAGGAAAMDEDHLLAAVRYIALNPVAAKLTARARDWAWASTRALLRGRDDGLVTVAPVLTRVPDFAGLIASDGDDEVAVKLDRAATIGRPLGPPDWIAELERRLGRPLAPRKRGRKPKPDPDSGEQQQLVFK